MTTQQANANFNYRQRIYQRYIDNGASQSVASRNADQAARRYASSQHRYRAETITHTELAFAYNRGSNIGVQRAIRQGLMGRCAMIWSTAGTNRVCSRCLALKDTVVGYTDESGVTLPPLHPRCRCTIIYDEIGTPQADKPLTSPAIGGNVGIGSAPVFVYKEDGRCEYFFIGDYIDMLLTAKLLNIPKRKENFD